MIYRRLAFMFPGRIEAIYIRKAKTKNAGRLSDYYRELLDLSTSFMLIEDSYKAMEHARKQGYTRTRGTV